MATLDDDSEFAQQRLHLTTGIYEHGGGVGECPVFRPWVGIGDQILDHLQRLAMVNAA